MGKIIIDYPDDMKPLTAMSYVVTVINGGRISENLMGRRHYSWCSGFEEGRVWVYTRSRRSDDAADSFIVQSEGVT